MKEKIETLYNHRSHFGGYMLVWICKMHTWMQAQIKDGELFWQSKLAHNSTIFIERAYYSLKKKGQKSNDKINLQSIRSVN